MAIKLIGIEFENFKSLKDSKLTVKDHITGIYGENGIGKTSVIEAWELLVQEFAISANYDSVLEQLDNENVDFNKILLNQYKKYIMNNQKNIGLKFIFQLDTFVYTYYKKVLIEEDKYLGYSENLSYHNVNAKMKSYQVFERHVQVDNSQSLFKYILFGEEIALGLDQVSASDLNRLNSVGSQMPLLMLSHINENEKLDKPDVHIENIRAIVMYVLGSSVIKLNDQSLIDLGICIPVNVHLRLDEGERHGKLPIKQFSEFYNQDVVEYIKKIFDIINELLKPISSGREVIVSIYDSRVIEHNNLIEEAIRIDIKQPNGSLVNIANESTGIIKLISILSTFTELISNENYLLMIDELDSHVYEYLLSTLIEQLNENIKGTIIFTSHNLTLFEKLHSKNFAIIQTNIETGNNEFTYIKQASKSTNLRSQYLRALYLGNDTIFPIGINENKLYRAFRKIVRGLKNDKEENMASTMRGENR